MLKMFILPELKSHKRIERSRPSLSPDSKTLPSGSNFKRVTGALCPVNKKIQGNK